MTTKKNNPVAKREAEEKKKQLKAKLLKIKLAGIKPATPEARRGLIQDTKNPSATVEGSNTQTQNRLRAEGAFINKNKKIRPTGGDAKMSPSFKKRLAKIKTAAVGLSDGFRKSERADKMQNFNKTKTKEYESEDQKFDRKQQENKFIQSGTKIRPTGEQATRINPRLKKRLAQLSEQKTAQEHGHSILMKGHNRGVYRSASLEKQQGHYAKYWLLNAKETNGNGWGIAAKSAAQNMMKFIGRPLVITSAKWHGASVYGDKFDHPYVPTNDLNKIFEHQEQFRVGNIVDVGEKNGDYYAMIEMLPKFANMTLPPFCSPAIYQLDAREAEGQISKWEALHLAALDENPAYGARIALLKGTCVGSNNECRVQFKSAKQKNAIGIRKGPATDRVDRVRKVMNFKFPKKNGVETERPEGKDESALDDFISTGTKIRPTGNNAKMTTDLKKKLAKLKTKKPLRPIGVQPSEDEDDDMAQAVDNDRNFYAAISCPKQLKEKISKLKKKQKVAGEFPEKTINAANTLGGFGGVDDSKTKPQNRATKRTNNVTIGAFQNSKTSDDKQASGADILNAFKNRRMKRKLAKILIASQGEQNMTFQDSKKIKIHKKKHPEVRKAQSSVEDIIRKSGSSLDSSHSGSTFLSTAGDFIGDKESHINQIGRADKTVGSMKGTIDEDSVIGGFLNKNNLLRVQNFPINRAGERRISVGVNSKVNKNQLKSIRDLETGGHDVGFVVGTGKDAITGRGSRDLTKILGKRGLL